jgi:hypothetical protein
MKLKVLISEGEDDWLVVELSVYSRLHLSGKDLRKGP